MVHGFQIVLCSNMVKKCAKNIGLIVFGFGRDPQAHQGSAKEQVITLDKLRNAIYLTRKALTELETAVDKWSS